MTLVSCAPATSILFCASGRSKLVLSIGVFGSLDQLVASVEWRYSDDVVLACSKSMNPQLVNPTTHEVRHLAKFDEPKRKSFPRAVFSSSGELLYVSSPKAIVELSYPELANTRILNSPATTTHTLRLSANGSYLLVGYAQGMRLVDTASLSFCGPAYTDPVSRPQWTSCCLTAANVLLAVPLSAKDKVYIWHCGVTGDMQLLAAPKEGLAGLVCHPLAPKVLAVSSRGQILLLQPETRQHWAGAMYPPKFRLEENNVEYAEPETEFDHETIAERDARLASLAEAENIEVDVTRYSSVAGARKRMRLSNLADNSVSLLLHRGKRQPPPVADEEEDGSWLPPCRETLLLCSVPDPDPPTPPSIFQTFLPPLVAADGEAVAATEEVVVAATEEAAAAGKEAVAIDEDAVAADKEAVVADKEEVAADKEAVAVTEEAAAAGKEAMAINEDAAADNEAVAVGGAVVANKEVVVVDGAVAAEAELTNEEMVEAEKEEEPKEEHKV